MDVAHTDCIPGITVFSWALRLYAGYPGGTYRGNRALTRAAVAAGLNA